jgi:hypothetical protein
MRVMEHVIRDASCHVDAKIGVFSEVPRSLGAKDRSKAWDFALRCVYQYPGVEMVGKLSNCPRLAWEVWNERPLKRGR